MKTNFWVDLGIFGAFLIAFEPRLTGVAVHEWFSLAFAATLVVHVILHWGWIVSLTTTYFKKLFHASRLDYLVDWLLFAAFTLAMLSGILISESILAVLGIQAPRQPIWRTIHAQSADLTLLLVGLHFALHWTWTVNATSRLIVQPVRRALGRGSPPPAQPVTKPKQRQPLG